MPDPLKPSRSRKPPATGAPVELGSNGKPKPTLASVKSEDAQLDYIVNETTPTSTFDPAYEAHMLRIAGTPWDEVARTTGYPTRAAAAHAVSKYLQKAAANQSAQHLQEALQTQVDRYETLLASWWQLGTTGHDDKAALVVLRALERIDRVLRLTDNEVAISKETLVISADPDEYVRQLKAMTEGN